MRTNKLLFSLKHQGLKEKKEIKNFWAAQKRFGRVLASVEQVDEKR